MQVVQHSHLNLARWRKHNTLSTLFPVLNTVSYFVLKNIVVNEVTSFNATHCTWRLPSHYVAF